MTNRLVDPLLLGRPVALERPEGDDFKHASPRRRHAGEDARRSSRAVLATFVAALVMVPARARG